MISMSKIDRLRQRLAVTKKDKLFGGKTEKQMRDFLKTPEGKEAFKLTGKDTAVYSEHLNIPKGFKKNVKQLKEETDDVIRFGDKFIHSDQRGPSDWQATDLVPSKKHKSKAVPAFGRGKNYIAIENLSGDVPPKVFSDTGKKNRMYTKGIEKMRGLNYPETKGLKRIPPSIVTGSGELGGIGQTPYSALAEQELHRSGIVGNTLGQHPKAVKNYKPTGRADAGGVKDIDILRRNITQQNAIRWSKLKQRIAQVRLAYAGPPVDVINAFRNKKALKMHAKNKKGKELSFQTDGETLFQSGYPIAKHTEKGISFSYQGHPSATTAQAGRMLGINTFHTKGKYYVNGNEVDPTQYDYTEVPFKDIQEGTVKVNKNIKTVPMTPEKRQLMKDQDFFSTKARRELKDPETGEIYDQVVVQPEDQREINRVTGLDTPIPEKTIATEIHHSIPKSKVQALRRSTTGAVALSPKSHQEAHFPERFVKRNLRKARLKIARMKQRNISRGMPRIAMGALARNVMQKARDNPLFKRGDTPTGYVYDEDKNIFLNAEKRADALAIRKKHGKSGQWLGINSVTDTDFGKKPVLRNEEGLRQIERELNDIEDIQKDRPILGGYEESIEASYPVIGDEKTILSRLNKNQESSLGIDPQGTAFLLYPDGKRTQITKD